MRGQAGGVRAEQLERHREDDDEEAEAGQEFQVAGDELEAVPMVFGVAGLSPLGKPSDGA